jgi:hypothetical protein
MTLPSPAVTAWKRPSPTTSADTSAVSVSPPCLFPLCLSALSLGLRAAPCGLGRGARSSCAALMLLTDAGMQTIFSTRKKDWACVNWFLCLGRRRWQSRLCLRNASPRIISRSAVILSGWYHPLRTRRQTNKKARRRAGTQGGWGRERSCRSLPARIWCTRVSLPCARATSSPCPLIPCMVSPPLLIVLRVLPAFTRSLSLSCGPIEFLFLLLEKSFCVSIARGTGESTSCSSARTCKSLTGKLLGWQIKGRSSRKAIAVCVAEVEDIQRYGDTAGLPEGLLQKLLPGPITIVLKRLKSAPVCKSLTADLDTLALRVPGPDVWGMWKRPSGQGLSFCRAIASSVGAIALTSANPSNSSSSLSPQEFRPLWEQLAYVFDGGIPPFCSCFQRRCPLVEDMFVCFPLLSWGDCPAEKLGG